MGVNIKGHYFNFAEEKCLNCGFKFPLNKKIDINKIPRCKDE